MTDQATEPAGGDADQSRPSWSRPGFVLSAVFVALLVIAGAWLMLTGDGPDDTVTDQGPSPRVASPAAADASASVCGLDPGEQDVPQTAPDTTWQVLAGVPVPASESAGPGRVDEVGVRWCYARSPWGAVLAASNFLMAQFDYHRLAGTVERSAVQDATSAGTLATFAGLTEQEYAQGIAATRVYLTGFRVTGYDGDTAVVDLLVRDAGSTTLAVPVVTVWSQGDWKVDMSATAHSTWTVVHAAAGFVDWAEAP